MFRKLRKWWEFRQANRTLTNAKKYLLNEYGFCDRDAELTRTVLTIVHWRVSDEFFDDGPSTGTRTAWYYMGSPYELARKFLGTANMAWTKKRGVA